MCFRREHSRRAMAMKRAKVANANISSTAWHKTAESQLEDENACDVQGFPGLRVDFPRLLHLVANCLQV